ncbi:11866_t:CDS:2, partial [Ambispora gerdemannii]
NELDSGTNRWVDPPTSTRVATTATWISDPLVGNPVAPNQESFIFLQFTMSSTWSTPPTS